MLYPAWPFFQVHFSRFGSWGGGGAHSAPLGGQERQVNACTVLWEQSTCFPKVFLLKQGENTCVSMACCSHCMAQDRYLNTNN